MPESTTSTVINEDLELYLSQVIELPESAVIFHNTSTSPHTSTIVHQSHTSIIPTDGEVLLDITVIQDNNIVANNDDIMGAYEDNNNQVISASKVIECEKTAAFEVDDNSDMTIVDNPFTDSMILEDTKELSTIEEDEEEDDRSTVESIEESVDRNALSDIPSIHIKKLGEKYRDGFITVSSTTPILSNSVTDIPLIHSVVIYPRKPKVFKKKSKGGQIHSLNHKVQQKNDNDEWRAAFPEPNPTAFDNSIFVDVAIQAMSVEEVDEKYPMMTPMDYAVTKKNYQIDGGASLTAISESKARELKCKFIPRMEFQIVVSVANGDLIRSRHYTPLKETFSGIDDEGNPLMKTVKILANIVPNLSGDIIIGSDVMSSLKITIPYNDERTATLKVANKKLTFKYNTTARNDSPMIKKIIVVKKKQDRQPISARESFNSLFYGDRYMAEQEDVLTKNVKVRPIPDILKKGVMKEYDSALKDPKDYIKIT